ncbi:MAG: hypothetical protein GF329_04055 [Candidatus Lokiarchaeota archaeon]|nr:hypothetical protein [Candidatus Lokiarchaeota archaeon]
MNENIIVLMDLDNFKDISNRMNWTRYSPNIITGNLTELIKKLVRKYFGSIMWGMSKQEGTEECLILFTVTNLDNLLKDLKDLKRKVEELGKETGTNATISIGVAIGKVIDHKPARSRHSKDLYSDPLRKLAKRALNEAKKRGGNKIVIK